MPRKRICLISFSPIARDARVLRQIGFLAPHYDLVVIGHGAPPRDLVDRPGLRWVEVAEPESTDRRRLANLGLLLHIGRLWPGFYHRWYLSHNHFADAWHKAAGLRCDAVHANDWNALPLAAAIARSNRCPLIFDAHEYSPLEYEEDAWWRWNYPQAITYTLRTYAPQVTASMTVCQEIADRYRAEYPLDPIVVLNAPERTEVPDHTIDPAHIRLIHHGGAQRSRLLETMIEAVARCDPRFSLDFMLVGDPAYVAELQALAERVAPGRVRFREPVSPREIVPLIAQYDLGFYLMRPTSYNNSVALPNKLFDFIAAGLGVCIGPSPAMAALAEQHGFGAIAPSFEAAAVADTLNRLDTAAIAELRRNARAAAGHLNAEAEMCKLVQLYHRLLA